MLALTFFIWSTNTFSAFPGRWRVLRWIASQTEDLELMPPRLLRLDGGTKLLVEAFNNRSHYAETDTLRKDVRVVRAFEAILKAGDIVFDIGANIGRMSVLAARLVGVEGKVFAFEPSPKVISSLYRNLAINKCSNVTAYTFAAADYEGTTCFHMPIGTNSAWGSIRDIGKGSSIDVELPVRSLDNLTGLPAAIRLLKIDVEGADLKVVRGAANIISTQRPVIILEFSPDWIRQLGDDPQWLAEFMAEQSYCLYQLTDDGPFRITELPDQQIDLLCSPNRLPEDSWTGLSMSLGKV